MSTRNYGDPRDASWTAMRWHRWKSPIREFAKLAAGHPRGQCLSLFLTNVHRRPTCPVAWPFDHPRTSAKLNFLFPRRSARTHAIRIRYGFRVFVLFMWLFSALDSSLMHGAPRGCCGRTASTLPIYCALYFAVRRPRQICSPTRSEHVDTLRLDKNTFLLF